MAGEKTEKATPKKRADARKKGTVAKSMDLNGAIVTLAALFALGAFGPGVVERIRASTVETLGLAGSPDVVALGNLGSLLGGMGLLVVQTVAPIAAVCLVAGVLASVAQVRWKPSAHALKPDPKRLDPIKGAKNIFGPNALFELGKTLVKVGVVGGIATLALLPELPELAALVGLPVEALGARLADSVLAIAWRGGAAFLVVGALDLVYQRYRTEKQLKMDKQEVKEEVKQYSLPAEVKSQMRRRQIMASRARMMDAVPDADVVVVNPTHFAVALRYDGAKAAPEVVAKGQDLVARQIRRIAEEHGVPVVSDPPLARSLHATVDVGRLVPEELFGAVAHLLAFVYRQAARAVA